MRKTLGKKRFSGLQPGASKKVKVKLTRKGRRIVRRQTKRFKLTAKVVVRDQAGGRQSLQRKLTVRPR